MLSRYLECVAIEVSNNTQIRMESRYPAEKKCLADKVDGLRRRTGELQANLIRVIEEKGRNHPDTAGVFREIGENWKQIGNYQEAEGAHRVELETVPDTLGHNHLKQIVHQEASQGLFLFGEEIRKRMRFCGMQKRSKKGAVNGQPCFHWLKEQDLVLEIIFGKIQMLAKKYQACRAFKIMEMNQLELFSKKPKQ